MDIYTLQQLQREDEQATYDQAPLTTTIIPY